MTTESRTIVGVFDDSNDAERAVKDLREMGFSAEELGYAGHGNGADVPAETSDVATGAAAGMIPGGIIGAALGAIAAGAIPGVGPVIAAGILGTALGGAAAGAAAGGIVGALVSSGVPSDDANYYEGEFHSGRTLVSVRAGSRATEAASVLRTHGARDIDRGAGGEMPLRRAV